MSDVPQIEAFTSAVNRAVKNPQIILFGSRLLGNSRPDSDVDIVVLSESFHGIGLAERNKLIGQAVADLAWKDADIIKRSPADWVRPTEAWLKNTVESQINEKAKWREMFERFGRVSVLGKVNAKKNNPLVMDDIGGELAVVLQPVPKASWPKWSLAIAAHSKPGDVGVGDTAHRKVQLPGRILETLGVPCGCDRRRDEWNLQYRY